MLCLSFIIPSKAFFLGGEVFVVFCIKSFDKMVYFLPVLSGLRHLFQNQSQVSCIAGRFLIILATREALKQAQKRSKWTDRVYIAAVHLLLGPQFQWAGTTLLPAVWTYHPRLFQDTVQDKHFSGASFQTKLSLACGLWGSEEISCS